MRHEHFGFEAHQTLCVLGQPCTAASLLFEGDRPGGNAVEDQIHRTRPVVVVQEEKFVACAIADRNDTIAKVRSANQGVAEQVVL